MPLQSTRAVACMTLCALLWGNPGPWQSEALGQTARPRPQDGPAARAAGRPAAVDDRRWQELADQAETALARGDFAGSERTARELVAEGLRIFGEAHPNTAAGYSTLASALFRQGRYAEAESQFRRALEIYERRSGPDSVNVASALNNLALVLERIGDYAGAEVLLRRSHGILGKSLGTNHPDTATTLSNLGRVLDSQGKLGADD